jgi:hypothetical protein
MMNRSSSTLPGPARKAVVFQPNVGVCLAVVFDDIIQCLETFREICVTYVASESLWS